MPTYQPLLQSFPILSQAVYSVLSSSSDTFPLSLRLTLPSGRNHGTTFVDGQHVEDPDGSHLTLWAFPKLVGKRQTVNDSLFSRRQSVHLYLTPQDVETLTENTQ
jgi:hypothetical protein